MVNFEGAKIRKISIEKIFFDFFLEDWYRILFLCIFAVTISNGPLAQLNRVFDYGSKGCRFESCMGHRLKIKHLQAILQVLFSFSHHPPPNTPPNPFLKIFCVFFSKNFQNSAKWPSFFFSAHNHCLPWQSWAADLKDAKVFKVIKDLKVRRPELPTIPILGQ